MYKDTIRIIVLKVAALKTSRTWKKILELFGVAT